MPLRRSARLKRKPNPVSYLDSDSDEEFKEPVATDPDDDDIYSPSEASDAGNHCTCNDVSTERMICCDQCNIWHHYDCVNLSDRKANALVASHQNWFCPSCAKSKRKRKKKSKKPSKSKSRKRDKQKTPQSNKTASKKTKRKTKSKKRKRTEMSSPTKTVTNGSKRKSPRRTAVCSNSSDSENTSVSIRPPSKRRRLNPAGPIASTSSSNVNNAQSNNASNDNHNLHTNANTDSNTALNDTEPDRNSNRTGEPTETHSDRNANRRIHPFFLGRNPEQRRLRRLFNSTNNEQDSSDNGPPSISPNPSTSTSQTANVAMCSPSSMTPSISNANHAHLVPPRLPPPFRISRRIVSSSEGSETSMLPALVPVIDELNVEQTEQRQNEENTDTDLEILNPNENDRNQSNVTNLPRSRAACNVSVTDDDEEGIAQILMNIASLPVSDAASLTTTAPQTGHTQKQTEKTENADSDSDDDILIQAGDKWVDSNSFLLHKDEFQEDIKQKKKEELEKVTKNIDDDDNTDFVVLNQNKKSESNICPLTLKKIEHPVKNLFCTHVYEREAITAYRDYLRNNGKACMCPQGGCTSALYITSK